MADSSVDDAHSKPVPTKTIRKQTSTLTEKYSDSYYMGHAKRGDCYIFVYDRFKDSCHEERQSATEDTRLCREAFKRIGFEVHLNWNLTKGKLQATLEEARMKDHSGNDAFACIVMTHGRMENGKEYLLAFDGLVETSTLWENFSGDRCPSLAGKPKLFFIQACRGGQYDHGVALKVNTDAIAEEDDEEESVNYSLPTKADILVLWAANQEMMAFRSNKNNTNGSVFIHYLHKILMERGGKDELYDLILTVTRSVALDYETSGPKEKGHAKQVCQFMSTLTRKVFFNQAILRNK